MIYAVNLTVDTKTTDLYDKVAVNKFPVIVIYNNEDELWEKLSAETTEKWIKSNIRTKHLFDTAYFYIRSIDGLETSEIIWKVDSVVKNIF
jgi:hypothetical protein